MSTKQLTVKKLNIENLADVMKLQQKIIGNLHPDEQHFILHTEKRREDSNLAKRKRRTTSRKGLLCVSHSLTQNLYGILVSHTIARLSAKVNTLPCFLIEC